MKKKRFSVEQIVAGGEQAVDDASQFVGSSPPSMFDSADRR